MKLTIEGEAKEIAAFLKETGKRLEGTQDKEIDFSDFDKSVLLVKRMLDRNS